MKIPDELESVFSDIRITEQNIVFVLGDKYGTTLVIVKRSPQFSVFKSSIQKQLREKGVGPKDIEKIINFVQINYKEIYPDDGDTSDTTQEKENCKLNPIKPNITYAEWQSKLKEKLNALKQSFDQNFPGIWQSVEFALSIRKILHIKEITLPFGGIIMGPPSSSKTLVLEMLRDMGNTFYTDSFTPKSFVSHNSALSEEKLREIDMLPKIKNMLFITPELGPLFSAKDEELTQVLGIMTRILDGHGYESDSGALGHRGYNEEIMFVWVGAVVDIPRKVYKQLAILGPKLYFFRLNVDDKQDEEYLRELKDNNFSERKAKTRAALLDYIKWFEQCPLGIYESIPSDSSNYNQQIKIKWDSAKDDENALNWIVKLGKLLAPLRGSAVTWETKDTQGSDYAYTTPTIENPSRAMTCLLNIAKGHALLEGRNYIAIKDIPILIKIVLSTAPIERVMLFDLLLVLNGTLKSSQIVEFLNISKPTALKTMTEFKILGLVNLIKESNNDIQSIKLKKEFLWILSEEFKILREGFTVKRFGNSNNSDNPKSEDDVGCKKIGDQDSVKKNTPHAGEENSIKSEGNVNNFDIHDPDLQPTIANDSQIEKPSEQDIENDHYSKGDFTAKENQGTRINDINEKVVTNLSKQFQFTDNNHDPDIKKKIIKYEQVLSSKGNYGRSKQQKCYNISQQSKIQSCKFCYYKTEIVFDLENHYLEYHKKELRRIPGMDIDKKIDDIVKVEDKIKHIQSRCNIKK